MKRQLVELLVPCPNAKCGSDHVLVDDHNLLPHGRPRRGAVSHVEHIKAAEGATSHICYGGGCGDGDIRISDDKGPISQVTFARATFANLNFRLSYRDIHMLVAWQLGRDWI